MITLDEYAARVAAEPDDELSVARTLTVEELGTLLNEVMGKAASACGTVARDTSPVTKRRFVTYELSRDD